MTWSSYSSNVLINPGGESGDLTGWTDDGAGTGGAFNQSTLTSTGSPYYFYGDLPVIRTGTYAFAIGPSTDTTSRIYQDVDLTAYVSATNIDAGKMRIQVGGWAKCLEVDYDSYRIIVQILNSSSSVIATPLDTGWQTSVSSFTNHDETDYIIPTNGRTVRISFYAYEIGYSAGVADDFYLYWAEDTGGGGTAVPVIINHLKQQGIS